MALGYPFKDVYDAQTDLMRNNPLLQRAQERALEDQYRRDLIEKVRAETNALNTQTPVPNPEPNKVLLLLGEDA